MCICGTRTVPGGEAMLALRKVWIEAALLGSTATNLRLVEDAVRMVRQHGEPATTAEVRQGFANG
ncbi:hypothetical protein IVB46_29375 [Bradyrhizobium sp. 61]|uniref:hypothetical protein n=1 Tax=unclassified Bradyrhizobium TaxID=2631580 RepID=UPI001FFA6121|nr:MULTISPECIES: hypothetical protein [unclassified Bradyrhizobium]MCK1279342.1 hypothetical protein [Bradyrhizobium sp. 61]MCK1447336.1 hypothetical protein [Bradyrhizobium sp. 48]MCK1464500.1 hypothetical protein [Bradyrhizobium sp. 2]